MTNKQAEERVRKAFSGAVPDAFEQILEKCQNGRGNAEIIKMPKRTGYVLRKLVSVAAALAIILTAGFAGYGIAKFESVDAIICFDVNPSIEIEINQDEKIVNAKGSNEDGQKILGEMDLAGSDLSVAVNAIIGSMLRNGYLDEISNSILISVDSSNEEKGKALEKKLIEEINMLLSGEPFDAAVLSQTLNATDEIKKLAKEYGITIGKAQLIQQIIDTDSKYSFKDLAPLTVNELNLIISGEKVNISSNGTASQKKYISKKKVKKKALKHADVEEENIFDYSCSMDYVDGKMIYVVFFRTDKNVYEYKINATSGKIIDFESGEKYIGQEKAKRVALDYAGTTEGQITEYSFSFRNEEYSMTFHIGTVRYYLTVDAVLGEVTKSTPNIPVNSEVEVPYISETEAKKAAMQTVLKPDEIYDYSCELGMNGKIPVYEIRFKAPGDTEILDCYYVISALTGEQLGIKNTTIEQQVETSSESTSSEQIQSEASGSIGTESAN